MLAVDVIIPDRVGGKKTAFKLDYLKAKAKGAVPVTPAENQAGVSGREKRQCRVLLHHGPSAGAIC